MKNFLFLFSFLLLVQVTFGQRETEEVSVTASKGKTGFQINDKGELQVNVTPKDLKKFKSRGYITYQDLGARGDGKADDIDAIAATHAVANEHKLKVKANDGATYYISGKRRTAIVRTDTDFGKAAFVIDDRNVENRNASVF